MLVSATAADGDDPRTRDRETRARDPVGIRATDPETSGLDGGSGGDDVLG